MFDLRVNPPSTWRVASIPKKDGTLRHLLIPNDELKAVQRNILRELEKNKAIKISSHAVGFIKYKNTTTGAMMHKKDSDVIIQIDIKDFFPSFPIGLVENNLRYARLSELDIDYIMKHSVFHGKKRKQLPQGAPTSPFLTNIGMYHIDIKLAGIAKRLGYTYSRYADDMCFASIPVEQLVNDPYGYYKRETERRIENRKAIIKLTSMVLDKYAKLKISWKKLQVSFKNSPRVPRRVTGVTIRKDGMGYNAPKKLRKEARGLTHILWKRLQEGESPKVLKQEYRKLIGLISYCDYIRSKSEEGYNGADPIIPVEKYNYIRKAFGYV